MKKYLGLCARLQLISYHFASCLILSADQIKDEVVAPILVAGMVVEEERKLEIETEMGKVVARLCQGP